MKNNIVWYTKFSAFCASLMQSDIRTSTRQLWTSNGRGEMVTYVTHVWRDLIESSMLSQCYVTATLLVILILFLNFWNFLNYDFFQNNKRHAFPKLCCSRLFSVDELIVLLEEKKARNPKFSYDRLELADVYNCKFKANFILRRSAEVSWSSASPWKILLFSEPKKKKITKMYMWTLSQRWKKN